MKLPADLFEGQGPNRQKRLRVVIISRRFWPYAGSTEFEIADLAAAIQRAGHQVEIVTARWEKNWPANFEFRELSVRRINGPPTSAWGTFRYLRNLIRYLKECQADGIIVFGLGDEAWSIARSFGGKKPFLIRIDNQFLGFRAGPAHLTHRQLAAFQAADQVIVESDWTAERLKSNSAVPQERLSIVPVGMTIARDQRRSLAKQGSARVAISDAHPMLMIESTQPLVVCGSPINGDQGMIDLVDAWPAVLNCFPNARLWIIGEGKQAQRVWSQIQDNHLVNSIIMPGSFDHLGVVFSAADLYVHPLRSPEACSLLTRALVSGVCCVATATQATEPVIVPDQNGILVPRKAPQALARAINQGLDHPDLRDRLGRAATHSLSRVYDVDRLLSYFLDPFVKPANLTLGSSDAHQESNLSSEL